MSGAIICYLPAVTGTGDLGLVISKFCSPTSVRYQLLHTRQGFCGSVSIDNSQQMIFDHIPFK